MPFRFAPSGLGSQNPFAPGQTKSLRHTIRRRITRFAWTAGSYFISLSLVVFPSFYTTARSALAASPAGYEASGSGKTVTLPAGSDASVTLTYKNTGTQTWIGSRANTSLYLYGDTTIFHHPSWLTHDLAAVITPAIIHPGQTATATFWVHAPSKGGTYTERFLLSVTPTTWMKGSTVTVTFNVTGGSTVASAPPTASAPATPAPANAEWNAKVSDLGGTEWQLDPLEHTMLTIAFRNMGSRTWANQGGLPVTLVTSNGRKSPFKDYSWKSDAKVSVLKEQTVPPGSIGHFVVELRAPMTPGKYAESFQLMAGDAIVMSGIPATLPISVTTPREFMAKGLVNGVDEVSQQQTADATSGYHGVLLLRSTRQVLLSGNARQPVTFGFKNTGTVTWNSLSVRIAGVQPALTGAGFSVRDDSWLSSVEPARATAITAPGQIGFIGFTIKVPAKKGNYTASFGLYADNQPVQDGEIDIPITVTADGYIEPTPTTAPNGSPIVQPLPLNGDVSSLPAEPILRVGVLRTVDDRMVVRAVSGGFALQQNGSVVCTFTSGQEVAVSFDRTNKVYKASGPGCTVQSTHEYVAVTPDALAPLEMTDFHRPVSWLPGADDNTFRGKLELHYAASTDIVWVINELPIEWYLKGIGETSNSSPMEYQRALLTAARTYAMYHVQHGTKHADEGFIVDAKYDQVYLGYGAEKRDPNVVQAVDDTRGQIVTYNGVLAITPYYSRSDGRTRSWTEVWGGGPYPWLVSVPVPWDVGKTLWGHGVGMSATGALGAAADGWTYDRILKHFYTGIELRRIYK